MSNVCVSTEGARSACLAQLVEWLIQLLDTRPQCHLVKKLKFRTFDKFGARAQFLSDIVWNVLASSWYVFHYETDFSKSFWPRKCFSIIILLVELCRIFDKTINLMDDKRDSIEKLQNSKWLKFVCCSNPQREMACFSRPRWDSYQNNRRCIITFHVIYHKIHQLKHHREPQVCHTRCDIRWYKHFIREEILCGFFNQIKEWTFLLRSLSDDKPQSTWEYFCGIVCLYWLYGPLIAR